MGKKKENKKRKEQEVDLEIDLSDQNSGNKEILLNVLNTLQQFCADNILALKPLLDEVEDNEPIKERIIHFATISDILDSVEQLTSVENSAPIDKKKKSVKKKK